MPPEERAVPWTHCEQEIADTEPCPACGLTKAEWTVEVDTTRTFVVASRRKRAARDAWIEVELKDAGGAPVAGAAYRVALPSGRVKKGALDAEGRARLEQLPAGSCQVSFPDHLPDPVERPTGARHAFQLGGGARLRAALRTSRGEPVDHARFVVVDAAGAQLAEGTTDGQGHVDVALAAGAGQVFVELVDDADDALDHTPPDEGEAAWVEGEFEQDPDEAWVLGS
jgi:hypothetical protein